MLAPDLVFTHTSDPAAQITCAAEGSALLTSETTPLPIVRCRLTGLGAGRVSGSAPIPEGTYESDDRTMALACGPLNSDGTCLLSRKMIADASNPFAAGVLVRGGCEYVCSSLMPCERAAPGKFSSGETAVTSSDPLLHDASAGAARGGRPSMGGAAGPVCLIPFVGTQSQRIPVFSAGR
jgi:hypothetical protein